MALGVIWSPLLCSADHCWGLLCCPGLFPPVLPSTPSGLGYFPGARDYKG